MISFKHSSKARSHREGEGGAREEGADKIEEDGTGKERRGKSVFLAIWDF